MLGAIADATWCFIDANIFYYHLVETPQLSAECSDFLERVERQELFAHTAAVTLAEAVHKVMLAEAVALHGLDRRGLAHRLQRRSHLIAGLHEHQKVMEVVRTLNAAVEPVTLDLVERASAPSINHRLLTNDALTLAAMERLGLSHLVTNDGNFDSIPGITVWKPRRSISNGVRPLQ
jgi:predicted nucleic acid-binding protein